MFDVTEKTSALYEATLQDEAGVAVAGSSLATLTLTLYDVATGTILNSRNAQNVLNLNGVTVSEAGALAWTMVPADNAITTTSRSYELHRAVFIATWDTTKQMVHEVEIRVRNIGKVPATP